MDINGIINMSENNKVVIFDFAQNVTKDSIEEISIQFKLDEAYSPEDN